MPAFPAEFGMPVRVDLVSSAPRKSERFYRELMGWEFRAAGEGGGRRVAKLMGMPVSVLFGADADAGDGGGAAASDAPSATADQWRVNFHVDDAATVVEKARGLGADVALEPVELVDGGAMAVIVDPTGAMVGLLQQPGEQAFVAAGEPGAPVWFELIAGDGDRFDDVVAFYHELFGWEIAVRARTEQGVYAVAMEGGAPFAGLVAGPQVAGPDQEGAFTGWLAYLGVENIGQAVMRTQELGGEVVVPVQDTEFGPLATIADPAGATTVLCEVPLPPEEDVRESDPLQNIDLSQFQ
ncbi:VOC family protein [Corynebacterium hansenii]|uniref:VOC family protein n=1 Tax=Corynebacterium hansenii TaxID=394964 RepID=A0ABV7ZQ98_9CORY|nr:VOC family protein [Corynebacterium hansenii]WJY98741.1 27 kDa antigen Cfp30B [Corynebacterium hansenii]